ncbi:MAG: acyl-CoA dehydrogenase family protein [Rhodobacterales bacterium]|nr:acyl-CoA dehydrogenase family protein [Rhodobacterales bacterium]
MYQAFRFDKVDLPPGTEALRQEVRAFLADWAPRWSPWDKGHSWSGFDRDFSRAVGARGWIGMAWPRDHGGAGRSMLERYVVIEEMLAAGAPVGAHWISDRQSGPLILRLGTEAQRSKYLPEIIRGEACFCIGLSEPDAGSDLAAVRSRAEPVTGGWRLNGRKIWTTNAHLSDYMIALVRTEGTVADRHKGLSQFIVRMDAPGVSIRQIADMTGEAHFNEVTFDDVMLEPGALIGAAGDGWEQVTAELAFERSGPDRFLSSFPALAMLVEASRDPDRLASRAIGQMVAELAVLRGMSLSVAGMLQDGLMPNTEAVVVKELGVELEQRTPELVRAVAGGAGGAIEGGLSEIQAALLQLTPTFSLRGGTREIVRGIIARGLGLR